MTTKKDASAYDYSKLSKKMNVGYRAIENMFLDLDMDDITRALSAPAFVVKMMAVCSDIPASTFLQMGDGLESEMMRFIAGYEAWEGQ